MEELGGQMIPAYSPQAGGRCERSFGTWQNRLPEELRLAGISTLQQANTFLRERYIAEFQPEVRQISDRGGDRCSKVYPRKTIDARDATKTPGALSLSHKDAVRL
jgi:hypothetical protein